MLAFAIPMVLAAAVSSAPASSRICPSNDRTPIVSQAKGSSLVPRGAVSLTVCRYNGLPGDPESVQGMPAHKLIAAGTTSDGGTIARLSAELDAIRPLRPGATYGCPADFGSKLLAFFVYRSRPGDVVTIGLTGCNSITNGHVRRLGRGAPVIGRLAGVAQRLSSPPQSPGQPPPVPIWEPG